MPAQWGVLQRKRLEQCLTCLSGLVRLGQSASAPFSTLPLITVCKLYKVQRCSPKATPAENQRLWPRPQFPDLFELYVLQMSWPPTDVSSNPSRLLPGSLKGSRVNEWAIWPVVGEKTHLHPCFIEMRVPQNQRPKGEANPASSGGTIGQTTWWWIKELDTAYGQRFCF